MTTALAAWTIRDQRPVRLARGELGLEKHLEEWIDRDTSLVGEGLRVLARQLTFDWGGRLDLLAVDPQGRLVLIEIKRASIYEDTITQALYYAATLSKCPVRELFDRISNNCQSWHREVPKDLIELLDTGEEDREVLSVLVGCGLDRSAERLLDYLSGKYGVPVRAVSLDVFDCDGAQILTREITEVGQEESRSPRRYTVEAVMRVAEGLGLKRHLEALNEAVQRHPELYLRPWAQCIMCAPSHRKTVCLFNYCALPRSNGRVKVWIGISSFDEHFGIPPGRARELLGAEERWLDFSGVEEFVRNLDVLMCEIRAATVPKILDDHLLKPSVNA